MRISGNVEKKNRGKVERKKRIIEAIDDRDGDDYNQAE